MGSERSCVVCSLRIRTWNGLQSYVARRNRLAVWDPHREARSGIPVPVVPWFLCDCSSSSSSNSATSANAIEIVAAVSVLAVVLAIWGEAINVGVNQMMTTAIVIQKEAEASAISKTVDASDRRVSLITSNVNVLIPPRTPSLCANIHHLDPYPTLLRHCLIRCRRLVIMRDHLFRNTLRRPHHQDHLVSIVIVHMNVRWTSSCDGRQIAGIAVASDAFARDDDPSLRRNCGRFIF